MREIPGGFLSCPNKGLAGYEAWSPNGHQLGEFGHSLPREDFQPSYAFVIWLRYCVFVLFLLYLYRCPLSLCCAAG